MGFGSTSPTPVYEDSTALIEWTNNVIDGRERAKHIGITTAFVSILRTKRHRSDVFVSRECPLMISSPMCSPRASSRHNSLQSLLFFSGGRDRDSKGRQSSRGET